MLVINNLEEMKKYLNADTNTYEFMVDGKLQDVEFKFDVDVKSNITAVDIIAGDITAWDISYYAVAFAYKSFSCNSLKGRRENSRHFCLDGDVVIRKEC